MEDSTTTRTLRGISLGAFCVLLAGCTLMKPTPHQGPWPGTCSLSTTGHLSTPEQRRAATIDCLGYASSTSIHSQTPMILWYQICMLQLGFRAPQGELLGVAGVPISSGGCIYSPEDPVCWAEKGGWPQDPPPRWSRSDTSRWTLEGDKYLPGAHSRHELPKICVVHGQMHDREGLYRCPPILSLDGVARQKHLAQLCRARKPAQLDREEMVSTGSVGCAYAAAFDNA